MKRGKTFLIITLIFALCFLFAFCRAETEGTIRLNALLRGDAEGPLSFIVSSPQYTQLAYLGSDRKESLNRLLNHFAIEISLGVNTSETSINIDGDTIISVSETTDGKETATAYSFAPDKVLLNTENTVSAEQSSFSGFLNGQFWLINRLMDHLYTAFGKIPETYPDFCREGKENLNYKGYGKAVRKTTIVFPADYVKENFPEAPAALAGDEETAELIRKALFSGAQKIILLYDEEGHILRINYDGTVGFNEESMRKVSAAWRCLRAENQTKDLLTLKSPAAKGNDRYNLSYTRDLDLTADETHPLSWDLQLDMKDGDVKKKVAFTADILSAEGAVTGTVRFSEKHDGVEHKVELVPEVRKENGQEYSGTIEITYKTGKIVTSSIQAGITVSAGKETGPAGRSESVPVNARSEEGKILAEQLENQARSILAGRMLKLPREDTDFLNQDIPADVWNSLVQSLY